MDEQQAPGYDAKTPKKDEQALNWTFVAALAASIAAAVAVCALFFWTLRKKNTKDVAEDRDEVIEVQDVEAFEDEQVQEVHSKSTATITA